MYELNGNLIGQLVVYNGNSQNFYGKSSLTALNEAINLYCVKKNTTSKVPVCTLSEHVYTVYSIYTYHYKSVTVGTYTNYTYAYTSIETYTIAELISVPCGASEDSYNVVKRISTYRDVVDVQIIDKLTGKAKCLNDLLNKNGDSFVQKLLANFAGKSEFNIEIVSKEKVISNETKLEINGITNHIIGSNLMTIEISIAKANENSALETARVILHEYIHADMFRKLNTIKDIKSQEIIDFKSTYNAYEKEKGHATMATLYINNMKEALKAFHKNVLPDDYKKYIDYYGVPPSDEFYEAFAWGGLKDSKVKPWTDLSPERKAAIEALASRAKNFSKIVLSCSN